MSVYIGRESGLLTSEDTGGTLHPSSKVDGVLRQ